MKKLSSREISILITTVVLAVIFIAYQFVIKPMQQGSGDINDELRTDQERLIKNRQLVSQKSAVDARYQDLANLIGVADSEESQMPTIISKIEAASRENNVHIANIQPQKSAIQKEAMFLMVEVEIDGQWLDIVRFLYALQQSPNFYFINELNLEKYSDTTNSLRGRIVISRMCLVSQ